MAIMIIESVQVRLLCQSKIPFAYRCEGCENCHGAGSYIAEISLDELVEAIRERLDPGPSS